MEFEREEEQAAAEEASRRLGHDPGHDGDPVAYTEVDGRPAGPRPRIRGARSRRAAAASPRASSSPRPSSSSAPRRPRPVADRRRRGRPRRGGRRAGTSEYGEADAERTSEDEPVRDRPLRPDYSSGSPGEWCNASFWSLEASPGSNPRSPMLDRSGMRTSVRACQGIQRRRRRRRDSGASLSITGLPFRLLVHVFSPTTVCSNHKTLRKYIEIWGISTRSFRSAMRRVRFAVSSRAPFPAESSSRARPTSETG